MILSDICQYVSEKISVSLLDKNSYISTENMLPNKSGITVAANLPSTKYTSKYSTDDILISNIRPYFKKIYQAQQQGGCSADVLVLRTKPGIVPLFLYYVLSDDAFFEYATATSKGTKMPRGDKTAIMKYEIPELLPETQQKIASLLSALDNKISLNQRQNNNLEQQAQALFKSWFVDFEPFGGTMPKDWKTEKLDKCTSEVIRGFTSKYVKKSNLINLNQKVNKGKYLEKQYYKFLDETISVPQEKYAYKKDILLNSLGQGTLGRIHFWYETSTNVVVDQHITIIRAKKGVSTAEYLYLLLSSSKYSDYFENCITGTTGMLMLNISAVRNADIMLPSIKIQEKFANTIESLYEKIEQNNQENSRLSALRDALLPKLISGEIDVSNVDISELSSADKLSFSKD